MAALKANGRHRLPWPAPSFFRTRPLLCGILCFLTGVALVKRVPYNPWSFAVTASLFVAGGCLYSRKRRAAYAVLLLAMLILGIARGTVAWSTPDMPATGRWVVEGVIEGQPAAGDKAVMFVLRDVRVQADGGAWTEMATRLYCYCPVDEPMQLAHGQRVSVQGTTYLPAQRRNPGGFDQAMWLAQKGAHVRMYATAGPVVLKEASFSVRALAYSVNTALGQRMDAVFGDVSPIIRAMLLGDQSAVPDTWYGWMQDSGIVHLLAVSGLHVGLWFMLLDRLLRHLPVSPRIRWLLLAILLCGYALLTGLKDSVLRASIMLLVLQGGHVARRKVDPLTSLAFAAFSILLIRPLDLFAAGFQLSFCAVLGLILLQPAFQRLLRATKLPKASETLCATVSAQAGVLPAASIWFGNISLVGIVTNLAAVPLAGMLIPVAAAAMVLDALWAPLGRLFVLAAKGMASGLVLLARAAASVPFAIVRLGAFAWWTAAVYFACLLLCSSAVIWRWKNRLICMTLASLIAAGIGFAQSSHTARYVQLDVGQALSGVLHIGSKSYVYDCGKENSDLTEYLNYCGADVEALFLSHPDSDHTGGLSEALDAGIRIKTIYVPANATAYGSEPLYETRLLQAQSQGTQIVELSAGDVLDLNGASATVLGPEQETPPGGNTNARSLVLLVEIGEYKLLLCGDATGASESLGMSCNVLQVGHHGGKGAAGSDFLQGASPQIALISVGYNNYGHPNAETIERLTEAGADIYYTKESGAITVYFERDQIRVEAYCK